MRCLDLSLFDLQLGDQFFELEQRSKVMLANPGMKLGAATQHLGALWRGASDAQKALYIERARRDSIQYSDAMAQWKQQAKLARKPAATRGRGRPPTKKVGLVTLEGTFLPTAFWFPGQKLIGEICLTVGTLKSTSHLVPAGMCCDRRPSRRVSFVAGGAAQEPCAKEAGVFVHLLHEGKPRLGGQTAPKVDAGRDRQGAWTTVAGRLVRRGQGSVRSAGSGCPTGVQRVRGAAAAAAAAAATTAAT